MSAQTEKPIRTFSIKAGTMYCETCNTTTIAKWTTTRIYKSGKEVERQECSECNATQETEFFRGPTTEIKTKG